MQLKDYVEKFNGNDEETIKNYIDNDHVLDYMEENAVKLYCPEKAIEETFAFRNWTFRKHIRKTEKGFLIDEFLNDVSWTGYGNTINAALCFHLAEAKWWKNSDVFLDYIDFFLKGEGLAYAYFTPALYEIVKFLKCTDNMDYAFKNIDLIEKYVKGWEERHLLKSGLFWSDDFTDAMEFSISGVEPTVNLRDGRDYWPKGVRPTLNSYMYADYMTAFELFDALGNREKAIAYLKKACELKKLINDRLWDGDFYKAVHLKDLENKADVSYKDIADGMNARELIGYIPFTYGIEDEDKLSALKYLKDKKVFAAKTGFATADMSNPRFLYHVLDHECLWNGYVWPYATSQTINAVKAVILRYGEGVLTNEDLYSFILTYANMHYRTREDGKTVNWIDEMMHPEKREWTTREILKNWNWREDKGGYERGKDYNHSSFCDLVLRCLIGIDDTANTLTVNPAVLDIWKWFKVENLTFKKQSYNIYYDSDGTKFNRGKGVVIEKI